MTQKINVNRSVQDPFYRYKMPRIVAKVEGKGNGIKTVIANMTDIAKALSRPPTYPTKYFGCELGAQTNFDLKNDRYIVNGEHDANKLQDLLDSFIKKFVLCTACENPETVLTVKKSVINSKCKACGHIYQIDPKQKLSTYIMKNPPVQESASNEAEGKENGGTPPAVDTIDNVDSGFVVDNNHHLSAAGSLEDGEDDDWAPEIEGKAEELSGEMSKMVVDKDLAKSEDDRLDMLHQYFQESMEDGTIIDGKKMVNEAERLEVKHKAPLLLVNVCFTEDIIGQIKKYRNLLLRFCLEDQKAQKHLLGGIEQKVNAKKDVLLPKTAHIIKALYDNDICEEEVLLSWGNKPSGRYVKKEFAKEMIKAAQPVLKWLQEAEEGSESDDNDVAVAFDDRSRSVGTVLTEAKAINKKVEAEAKVNEITQNYVGETKKEVEDDLDIDDI